MCKKEFSYDNKKYLVVFHNGSNYDFHFIIKELRE